MTNWRLSGGARALARGGVVSRVLLTKERLGMNFDHTEKVKTLVGRLEAFFDEHIHPNERAVAELVASREGKARWEPIPLVEQLSSFQGARR